MSLLKGIVQGAAQGFVDSAIGKFLGHGASGEKQGFNAQNMLSSLSKSGVAHSGHFEVQVTGPRQRLLDKEDSFQGNIQSRASTGLGGGAEREMIYRAEAAEIPGRSIATVEHRFDNYSPISRVATGQTYTPITISFLLSEDLREKEYFEQWHDQIVGTGAFTTNSPKARSNAQYYHQYVGSVIIRQYGSNGQIKSIHTLNEAYPYVIGGIGVNWNDDAHMRLQVQFTYQSYQAVFYKQDQAEKGMSFGFSLGKGGLSASLSVPGIGSIGTGGGRSAANFAPLGKKIFSSIL